MGKLALRLANTGRVCGIREDQGCEIGLARLTSAQIYYHGESGT